MLKHTLLVSEIFCIKFCILFFSSRKKVTKCVFCIFYIVNKYVLITSRYCGLIIYDVKDNKFILSTQKLTDYASKNEQSKFANIPSQDLDHGSLHFAHLEYVKIW